MSSDATICTRCRNSAFKPRIDVNFLDLYSKLRSESGPFSLDPREASEILLSCEKDLEDSENEIIRLQSHIMYIQEQQKRLKDYKTKIHSLTSPIRRLPNEILGVVFDAICDWNILQEFPWGLTEDPPTEFVLPVITYLPALSISSTCTRWRAIALSCPSLWSRLKIVITSDEDAEPALIRPFIDVLLLFLARSGQHSLEIDLDIRGGDPNTPLVLDLLMNLSQRWRTFKFEGSQLHLHDYLDNRSTLKDFSALESLDVSGCIAEFDVFQTARKLRELLIFRLEPLDAFCSQITLLDIYPLAHQLGTIIEQYSNLTSLKLNEFDGDDISSIQDMPHTTSNTLTTLNVVVTDSGFEDTEYGLLEASLASLTLPSLTELRISGDLDRTTCVRKWPRHLLASFLHRSSCRITTLVLSAIGLSHSDLVSALQLLPSLLTLDISDREALPRISPITSDFISALHSSNQSILTGSNNCPLIPRLRNLTLEFSGADFDDANFIGMISSRWLPDRGYAALVGVDCLRSVVMRFCKREVVETVYRPLKYLDKMGLRVVVTGKNGSKV